MVHLGPILYTGDSSLVMKKRLVLIAAQLALPVFAQDDAQLVWEGEVDGTIVLHVRDNRLDVEERAGRPVTRERSRFHTRLPELRQDVSVETREGRGTVRVLEQPRPDNGYKLSVLIDDRQGGSGFYSLSFHWDTPRQMRPPPRRRSLGAGEQRLAWSGRVDGEVAIDCRREQCYPQVLRGAPVVRDRADFSRPLPQREVRVSLDEVDGRGEVELIDQPSELNNYTARVRIRDTQGGAGDYAFSLFWTPPARGEPERLFARPGLVWSGRVDGTVRVAVDDGRATTQVLNGGPVTGERANFLRSFPRRSAENIELKKVRGRGRVEVVEYPSARNGYRLVFEINDRDGGAGEYEVEVGW